MKKNLLLLLAIFGYCQLQAQSCKVFGYGDTMGPNKKIFTSEFLGPDFIYINNKKKKDPNTLPCKAATVNVYIHLIHNAAGLGGVDAASGQQFSEDVVTGLNTFFNPGGITIRLAGWANENTPLYEVFTDIKDIDKYDYINSDYKFNNSGINPHYDGIDIYFYYSEPYYTAGSGVAILAGTGVVMFGQAGIQNTNLATNTVLAHELGHCFNLHHTFYGTGCNTQTNPQNHVSGLNCPEARKLVAGNYVTNGAICGDYVDDTPPDPTESWSQVQLATPCVNVTTVKDCNNTSVDAWGTKYEPLTNNIMDYIPRQCMENFTDGQFERMFNALAYRDVLHKTLYIDPNSNPTPITISSSLAPNAMYCTGQPLTLTASNADNYFLSWLASDGKTFGDFTSINPNPQQTTTYTIRASSGCHAALPDAQITIVANDDAVFDPIVGDDVLCVGLPYTFSNPHTFSSQQWVSSNTNVLQLTSGQNTSTVHTLALADGKSTLTYKVSTTHCADLILDKHTKQIEVTGNVLTATIAHNQASNTVCSGTSITLTATGTTGLSYTWYNKANLSVAIGTGNVITVTPTNTAAASTTIIYLVKGTTICNATQVAEAEVQFTVNPLPVVSVVTPPPNPMCMPNTYTVRFSPPNGNFDTYFELFGYNYGTGAPRPTTISNTAITATYDEYEIKPYSKSLTGYDDPKLEYRYTDLTTNCVGSLIIPLTILPETPDIVGQDVLCSGNTYTYTTSAPNATWSIDKPNIATIDPISGVVTPLSMGTATISCTANICGITKTSTKGIMVWMTPAILGPGVVAVGSTNNYALTALPTGFTGSWGIVNASMSNPQSTTQPFTCSVTAYQVGSFDISFAIPNANTFCGLGELAGTVTRTIVVLPCSGSSYSCNGTIGSEIDPTTISTNTYFADDNFCIKQDITIDATVNIINASVGIADGVSIRVTKNGRLNIYGSHLFGHNPDGLSNGMWQGITVYAGGQIQVNKANVTVQLPNNSYITFQKSSLIEDALTAISYDGSGLYNFGTADVLLATNTIFNRNNVGIAIAHINDNVNRTNKLPFKIDNCIFTSRVIADPNCALIWPTVADVRETPASTATGWPLTPQVNDMPYIDIYAEDEA